MRYDDSHRAFLQAIIHAGIMSDYDMKQTAATIFDNRNEGHVIFMNTRLEPLRMAIKSGNCEFTGEKYWMLTTTTYDNAAQFPSEFSPAELELLRKIFQEIISSEEGRASSLDCLNAPLESHFSKETRQQFLNDIVRRMWLDSREGYYYIGVRSIIELMPYFKATFGQEFHFCPLCKQTVFHGQRCQECQVVAHLYCLANYARVQKPLKCLNCRTVVPTDDLPAVQELTLNEDETVISQEDHPSQTKRKKYSRR